MRVNNCCSQSHVTQPQFPCNLQRNAVAKLVAQGIERDTVNLQRNVAVHVSEEKTRKGVWNGPWVSTHSKKLILKPACPHDCWRAHGLTRLNSAFTIKLSEPASGAHESLTLKRSAVIYCLQHLTSFVACECIHVRHWPDSQSTQLIFSRHTIWYDSKLHRYFCSSDLLLFLVRFDGFLLLLH